MGSVLLAVAWLSHGQCFVGGTDARVRPPGATVSLTTPSGADAGALLLATFYTDGNTSVVSSDAGWLQLGVERSPNHIFTATWFQRRLAAADPAVWTFATTGVLGGGVDATLTAFDSVGVIDAGSTQIDGNAAVAPAVSAPLGSGVAILGVDDNSVNGPGTFAPPAGFSLIGNTLNGVVYGFTGLVSGDAGYPFTKTSGAGGLLAVMTVALGPCSGSVDAGGADAGAADSGTADAGSGPDGGPGPRAVTYTVGCGCTSAPAPLWVGLALLGWRATRRARGARGTRAP